MKKMGKEMGEDFGDEMDEAMESMGEGEPNEDSLSIPEVE